MKKSLLAGMLVATALAGFNATDVWAQQDSQTWTVAVHFRYSSGFNYDYVIARGFTTEGLPTMLEACGSSHYIGSAIQYHCFAIPE